MEKILPINSRWTPSKVVQPCSTVERTYLQIEWTMNNATMSGDCTNLHFNVTVEFLLLTPNDTCLNY